MFKKKFGIEIKFIGITRNKASKIVDNYLNETNYKANDNPNFELD